MLNIAEKHERIMTSYISILITFFINLFSFQFKDDPKYNLIILRILSQYVNFRARSTACNQTLVQSEISKIVEHIWLQMQVLLSSNFMCVVMVLLGTDAKDLPQDHILYPLFEKANEFLSCGVHIQQDFPEILTCILTILFYKHWGLISKKDSVKHKRSAKMSLKKYYNRMPDDSTGVYEGFVRRVDDRLYNALFCPRTVL